MKYSIIYCLFVFLFSFTILGQTNIHKEKFRNLEPDLWLHVFDKDNSSTSIVIDTLSYDDIPKYLDFRGTVIEALKWNDSSGENILIQTVTGIFNWKDYDKEGVNFDIQDKAELYAYLFHREDVKDQYTKKWKIYDFIECFGVDWYIGFLPKATTITDLDKNGIAEITIPYMANCRGGMDSGIMKIIMYESDIKYALRGSTMLMCESENAYGGEFTESDNLKNKTAFKTFLTKHWHRNKCEEGKFYE